MYILSLYYLFLLFYINQKIGQKFKIKNLREEFKEAQKIPVKEQKKYLHQRFTEWKGDLEQVDDVMIIGIEL